MKNIKLSDSQYKLLLSVLDETIENRNYKGCNDVYERELKLFNILELQEALNNMGKKYSKDRRKEWELSKIAGDVDGNWSAALKNGWGMFDSTFVQWLYDVIKRQK